MDDASDSTQENTRQELRFNPDGESTSASAQAGSRDGSPQRGRGAQLAALHGFSNNEEERDDPSRTSYQGPFDPFALPGDSAGTPSKAGFSG